MVFFLCVTHTMVKNHKVVLMQNPHVKYLQGSNGSFHLFYHEHGVIFLRSYVNNAWTMPIVLAETASPMFSLSEYESTGYILYTTMDGNLFLATSTDFVNWEHKSMMRGSQNPSKTKFFMMPTENAFHIIYHMPTESTGIDSLVYTVFQNGRWEKPYQIDRFLANANNPFFARRLDQEHVILYYRTGRNVWSAREMLLSPYTMGSLTPLFQTPTPCTDLSIVNDNERIHLLYVVKGMFRTQLVYQYKHTLAVSTPRIIWEGPSCENCLAYFEHGNLILIWTVNAQPYRCLSENNGALFGSIEKFTTTFPGQCVKGECIGTQNEAINASEFFGDAAKGYLPSFLPAQISRPSDAPSARDISPADPNKASAALKESHQQQLQELTQLLSQRSDEISTVNAHWKSQIGRLEAQLQAALEENQRLQKTQPFQSPVSRED